jgi:two-component system, NarL family, sensor kinase
MGKKTSERKKLRQNTRSRGSGSPPVQTSLSADTETADFRALVETVDVGLAIVSPAGIILFANKRFAETLGLSANVELVGTELRGYFSRSSMESLESALGRCVTARTDGEMRIQASEKTRVVRLCFEVIPGAKAPIIGLLATEVTELVEKRKALVESKASVHSLSARVLQLQDEERRRISRDLHDVVGQELAVLSMGLARLGKTVSSDSPEVVQGFDESLAQLKRIEEGVRTLSYLLHPPLLDELGLGSALHWYIDGFAKRSGIEVEKDVSSHTPRFGLDVETALFRVVQESLANVLRHSGSRRAKVHFWVQGRAAHICVEDQGKGIPAAKLQSANDSAGVLGVGISGMRQRLHQLGGSLRIRARHPGVQVLARVPVTIHKSEEAETFLEERPYPQPVEEPARAGQTPKRILIADDHEVTRQGLRTLFATEGDLEVCGEAQNGAEAIEKAYELKPDIVVMDLNMPKVNGIAAAVEIRRSKSPAKILAFTSHAYPQLERVVRTSGFDGYVLKSDVNEDLVRAVRAVLHGDSFYRSQIVRAQTAG